MATANKPLFKNLYFKRKVADSQARACFICCKPTTAVLVTENGSADFFYICEVHLKDVGFASPAGRDSCPAAATAAEAVDDAKSKIGALNPQINSLEKRIAEEKKAASSYFNFFKGKNEKSSSKHKDKKMTKTRNRIKKKEGEKDPLEKDQDLLDKLLEAKQKLQSTVDAPARIFELSKSYYVMRLNKHRTARVAVEENKKVDDLMKQMMQLPSVPKSAP